MKFVVVCCLSMMLVSQIRADCWEPDPYFSGVYRLTSADPNCLNNSIIPRNATQLYDLITFGKLICLYFRDLIDLELKSVPEGLFQGLTNLLGMYAYFMF
jgi:hypothetical protein